MKNILNRIVAVLGSRRFFVVILAFFVFEAAWIALSAVYPMAFDEDFHFGIIQIYSHHWLPFLGSQPPNSGAYGAVTRDPSYLYQYLMSFPYRLINLFTHSQTIQVIILRFINIGLFAGGLVLFRKVLLRAKLSRALTNVSLLLFVLIPIVPQVAGQINYDNLVFLLVPWVCLLTFRATDELRQKRPSVRTLLMLATVCVFASLVKYEFMPIFAGVIFFLLFVTYTSFHWHLRFLGSQLLASWKQQSWLAKSVLVILFAISLGLFAQRDVVNLVKYHAFTPDCATVLSVKECRAYGPWAANYQRHMYVEANKGSISFNGPIRYFGQWVYWLWYRMFFAVNGRANSYQNYPPMPLPAAAAVLILVAGLVAAIIWRQYLFRNVPYAGFFLIVILVYLAALCLEGFEQYRYTNVLTLMNGRYLLPVLLLMAVVFGSTLTIALRKFPVFKGLVAVFAILLFLQGGGVLTFISRSDPSWYWPNSAVVKANNAANKVTNHVTVKGSKYYSTRVWLFN